MRTWFKRSALAAVVVLAGIQLIPVNRRNPPVDPAKTMNSVESVPPKVQAVFQRSCADCHSNQTVWPWYSYVAPGSWVVAHDVHQARSRMNFSEWGDYSAKKKSDRLETICDEVLNDDMPDGKYVLIHRKARLTQEERQEVCAWTQNVMAKP